MEERFALNKLNAVSIALPSKSEDTYYNAMLTNQINLQSQLMFSDINNPSVGLFGTVLANAAFGVAPAFSMPRKMAFSGSTPMALHLDTVLKLVSSVEEDFVKPLQNLASIVFPTESEKSILGLVDDAASGTTKQGYEEGTLSFLTRMVGGLLASGGQSLIKLTDSFLGGRVSDVLSKVYFLNVPEQLSAPDGAYIYMGSPSSPASIKLGPYIFKGVSISLGKLVMEGGLPEIINVGLDLESYKTVTTAEGISNFFTQYARSMKVQTNLYVEPSK